MTTTFLLIRHAETDATGTRLTGWQPGWHLNQRGVAQARHLAHIFSGVLIGGVYCSPLERAMETAEPIASRHGLAVAASPDLGEMHIGEWEGCTFEELRQQELWRRFNSFRSGTRPPKGELMGETQARMVQRLDRIREQHADEVVAVVSHCDPLRSVVAHFLGISLDLVLRFEISPASTSVVQVSDWTADVLCLNYTGGLPL